MAVASAHCYAVLGAEQGFKSAPPPAIYEKTPKEDFFINGGERGIQTIGTIASSTVFEIDECRACWCRSVLSGAISYIF